MIRSRGPEWDWKNLPRLKIARARVDDDGELNTTLPDTYTDIESTSSDRKKCIMFLESKNSFSFKTERFFYLSIFQLVSNYSGRKVPSQRFETVLFFRRVAIVWRARKIGMRFYKQNGEHDIE